MTWTDSWYQSLGGTLVGSAFHCYFIFFIHYMIFKVYFFSSIQRKASSVLCVLRFVWYVVLCYFFIVLFCIYNCEFAWLGVNDSNLKPQTHEKKSTIVVQKSIICSTMIKLCQHMTQFVYYTTYQYLFFSTPSEVCRSCIFHYWWPLTLVLLKKRFFRISPCLVCVKCISKCKTDSGT